jgi:hypothetical protein
MAKLTPSLKQMAESRLKASSKLSLDSKYTKATVLPGMCFMPTTFCKGDMRSKKTDEKKFVGCK